MEKQSIITLPYSEYKALETKATANDELINNLAAEKAEELNRITFWQAGYYGRIPKVEFAKIKEVDFKALPNNKDVFKKALREVCVEYDQLENIEEKYNNIPKWIRGMFEKTPR